MHAPPEPASPTASATARGPRLALVCVLLAVAAWSGSIVRGGFAFDDREAIVDNPVVSGSLGLRAAFERDYWEHLGPAGHYRPLASLSLRLDERLHGHGRATGWHLTNVVLHALVVGMLALGLLLLGPAQGDAFAWTGVALFAVHPALADSVAWISGRTSMVSAAAGLAGAVALLVLWVPWRAPTPARLAATALVAAVGLAGALLGKEDGLVFAPLYAALAARASRRVLVAALAGTALGLLAYLSLRAGALGSPFPSAPHAPLGGAPLVERLLVAGRALLEGLRLFAAPIAYPPSYERAAFLARPAGDPGWHSLAVLGWLPWVAALLVGGLGLRRAPRSVPAAGAVLAALSLVPVLQFVPAGALFAPRFLYLPLLFAAPALHVLWRRARGPAWLGAAILLACVGLAWQRAGVYADRASFQREVLRHRPGDPGAWNDLGLAHEEQGELERARAAFERAAALDPTYGRPWSNLGRLALADGRLEEAEACLRTAVARGAVNPIAHLNLGAVLLRRGRPAEAADAYARATRLAPGLATAWLGYGRALQDLGRTVEAIEAYRRARAADPADGTAARRLRALGELDG